MLYYNKTTKELVSEGNIVNKYNISLPRGTQYPPQDILDALTLIPVHEAQDKPTITEYQELQPNPEDITYDETTDLALMGWLVKDVIVDELDESGNIIKTKEQKLDEIKKQREIDEQERIKQQEEQEALRKQQELEQAWTALRARRNQLLLESDKYVLPDYPHKTDEIKQAWLDYRQALRDITSQTETPYDVTFPEPPL